MKYNLNEIKEMVKDCNEIEIYKFTDKTHRLHTDCIESVGCDIDEIPTDGHGMVEAQIEVMDEQRYNETVCANDSVEFADMFDEGTKVGVVAVVWLTFDVVFQSDTDSNCKGFAQSEQECRDYISMYNGTRESYFEDYKGGTVQVVCNETGDVVYEEEIR